MKNEVNLPKILRDLDDLYLSKINVLHFYLGA